MATILITGANRGLGLALAELYQQSGWHVIATGRDVSQLTAADEKFALDVGDSASRMALKSALGRRPLDILWNNAGIYADKGLSFEAMGEAIWRDNFAINVIAPIMLTQLFMENLLVGEQKLSVYTSSMMGSFESAKGGGSYAYRASKAALNMAIYSFSRDCAALGCKFVLFHPGWVQTAMGGGSAPVSPKASAAGMQRVLAGGGIENGDFIDYQGHKLHF